MSEAEIPAKSSPKKRVAVVMQRRAIDNRWQQEVWEPVGVLQGYDDEKAPRVLVETENIKKWLYPGFELARGLSEGGGYYHNWTSNQPGVFVLWRMEAGTAVPQSTTVSYDEGS